MIQKLVVLELYRSTQPVGSPGDERVLRGGSWNNNQDNARVSNRNNNNPNNRNNNNGFRVVVRPTSTDNFHMVRGAFPPAGCAGFITGMQLPELIGVHGFRSEAEYTEKARAGPVRTCWCTSGIYQNEARPDSETRLSRLIIYPPLPLVCLSQPPSKRPNSATITLTC